MKHRSFRRRRPLGTVVAAILAAQCPLSAQTAVTWTGAASNNFTDAGNWVGAVAPAASEIANFAGTPGLTSVNFPSVAIAGITFASGATAFDLAFNGTVSLGANGVTNASASTQTLSGALALGAAATFATTGTGTTVVSANLGLAGQTVTFSGGGETTVSGSVVGSGALVKSGPGTLALTGSNSFAGDTTLAGGTLVLGNSLALGTGGMLTFSGGTLQFSAAGNADVSSRFSNAAGQAYRVDTGGQDVTLAASLSSSGGTFTKSGAGALTLSGLNSFDGTVTVQAGTLAAGSAQAFGTGALVVAAGATLDSSSHPLNLGRLSGPGTATGSGTFSFDSDSHHTLATVLAGTGALAKAGAGTLTLSGDNTYTGATQVNAGTLRLGAGGAAGSVAGGIVVDAGAILSFHRSDSPLVGNLISGAGAVTLDGPGTIVFTADHAYTGGTRVNSGTLRLGAGGATGGVVGDVALASGATLVVNRANDLTLAGAISGAGTLTKENTNVLTLVGASTVAGTTVAAGTLQLGGAGSLAGTALSVAAGATFDLNHLTRSIGSLAGAGNVTLGSGTLTVGGASTSTTFSGNVSGAGSVAKSGTGTLTLGGANTFTGGIALEGGTLALGSTGALGSSGPIAFGGGALQFSAANTTDYSSRFANASGQAYAIDTNGQNVTFATALTSSGGTLAKSGAGALFLAADNTYAGATTIQAGGLQIGVGGPTGSLVGDVAFGAGTTFAFHRSNAAAWSGNLSGAGTFYKFGADTLILAGNNYTPAATVLSAGTLAFDVATAATFGGSVSGAGAIRKLGAGTLTITGNNPLVGPENFEDPRPSHSGGLEISNGTVAIDVGAAEVVRGGNISGAGAVQKLGSGSLTLVGTHTYTGGTTVTAGSLVIGEATGYDSEVGPVLFGSIAGSVAISGGASFVSRRSNDWTLTGGISGAGTLVKEGHGTLYLTGDATHTGGTTVTLGSLRIGAGGTTGSITGNVAAANGSALVFDRANAVAFSGNFSGNGALYKLGGDSLTLTGANTHGSTTFVQGGTLVAGSATAISPNSLIAVSSGATLNLANYSFTLPGLSATGTVDLGSGTLTLGNGNASSFFDGVVTGTGGIVKMGTGTVTLAGANTYTGATTVLAGTLLLGTVPASAPLVSDGAIFGFHTAGTLTYAHPLTGATGFAKAGTGTVTLTGINTHTGGTQLQGGWLTPGNAGAFGPSGAISFVGGGIKYSAADTTDFSGRFSPAAGQTFQVDTGGQAVAWATPLAGAGNHFSKTGAGTLTLSGLNTYTGFTAISGGTLVLSGTGSRITQSSLLAMDATGSLTLDAGARLAVTSNAQIGRFAGSNVTASVAGAGSQLTAGGYIEVGQTGNGALMLSNGAFASSATSTALGVLAGSSGTLTLTDSTLNVGGILYAGYLGTGTLTIGSGGNVTVGGHLSLGDQAAGSGTLTLQSGGTLTVGGTAGFRQGAGSATVNLAGGTLRAASALTVNAPLTLAAATASSIDTNGTTIALFGNVGGAGALVKSGAGTLTLTGANTYTGGTTVAAGTLTLGVGTTFGSLVGDVALGSGTTFGINRSDALTFPGAISGAGSFVKSNLNTVTLAGTAAYGGTTQIDAGTLVFAQNASSTLAGNVAGAGTLAKTGTGTLTFTGTSFAPAAVSLSGGTLEFSSPAAAAASASISGAGALVKSGAGTLTLSGTNTYTGGTTVAAGTLVLGAGGTAGSLVGDVTLGSGATFGIDRSDAVAFPGAISGTGSFAKHNFNTVTLAGNVAYAGTTQIDAGTLVFAQDSSTTLVGNVAGAGTLAKTGTGTLTFTGTSFAPAAVSLAAGTLQFSSATAATASAPISGAGALVKSGAGTLTLTGASTHTGGTTVVAGTLQLGGAAGSLGGTVAIGSGATLALNRSGVYLLGFDSSGAGSLLVNGPGVPFLTGDHTFTGGTTIASGGLQIGNAGATGSFTGDVAVASGTTFAFDRTGTTTWNGSLSGAGTFYKINTGTVILTGAAIAPGGGTQLLGGTLQIGNGGATGELGSHVAVSSGATLAFHRSDDLTFSHVISGPGALAKSGAGTLTLTADHPLTGTTSVAAGTLQLGTGGATGSVAGPIAISAGASLVMNRASDLTFSSAISGAGSLVKMGTGHVVLSADNAFSGPTTISAGTLHLGNGGTTGSVAGPISVAAGATLTVNRSNLLVLGNVTGAGQLVKNSPGVLQLGSGSALGGATALNLGILSLTGPSILSPTTTTSVAAPAILALNGHAQALGALTGSGTVNLGGAALTIGAANTDHTFSGVIAESGSLAKTGTGTLELANANTYSGATTIASGTLRLGATGALPSGTPLTLASGATFNLNGHAATLGSLSGAGSIALGSATLAIAQSSPSTFSGSISGSGGLAKSGDGNLTLTGAALHTGETQILAGTLTFNPVSGSSVASPISGPGILAKTGPATLTLTGVSPLTGATHVQGGTLAVMGSLASSAVTVASGATLAGSGSVGAVTVAGNLSPGSSPGTLTAASATFAPGGSYTWELNNASGTAGAASGWDLLSLTGALTVTATSANPFSLRLTSLDALNAPGTAANFDPNRNYSFNFVTAAGGITGFSASAFSLDTSAFSGALGTWSVAASANALALNYSLSAIPEPSTYAALAGLAALALAAWRRRRS